MRFRVLGPLEVDDEGRKVALGGPTPRALLAILLLRRGEVVPAEQLIEHVYGGVPPAKAAKSIQAHVSRLRKALGDERLRTAGGGYSVVVSEGELDVDRFDELALRGRDALARGDPEDAVLAFREALTLWRGPPFVDFRYSDFAQAEISRLEERRLGVVEDRIEAQLALGRHADLVPELNGIVADFPFRERPRAQLMVALYRSGRQTEALETYREARRVLVEELGIEPGEELKSLERAILEHDPSLAAPDRMESAPLGAPRAGPSDFVGRSAELKVVRKALADVLAGHGRLLLISGEPGIGKSRLADELMSDARQREARVLVGRCWEAGGAPAYWPWIQSLRMYMRDCDPGPLRAQLGAGASDLAQLFPELDELFPDLPRLPSIESEGARFRLFDATATFLIGAAREHPLVIVLDDLHAGDEPSLLMLRFLARELGDSRLLVVGLYRDVDPMLREPFAPALAELRREPVTRHLQLVGLTDAEVVDFVARTTDVIPSAELVTAIYEETDGNPLFVGEIVRLLIAEGQLDSADVRLSIPEGVRDVIERRVRRLSDEAAHLLVLASILGREFELEALARFSGRSTEDTLSLLDEALAERVVGGVPGARDRVRFAHQLIRDTLYDGLAAGRRMRLHKQAGEALEELYAENIPPHLAELAHHFVEAAPAGDVEKAVRYARLGGDEAVSLLAYEEAVRLYRLALALTTNDVERCDVLLEVADAQARAGDTPASKQTYREAAELADQLGLPSQLARAALGYGGRILWLVSRDDEYLIPLLEKALALLEDKNPALRVRLLARLASGPLRDSTVPPNRRRELSREALETARRLGDPATLVYALESISEANLRPDTVPELLQVTSEWISVATEVGDLERLADAHESRLQTLLELGELKAAQAELEALTRIARELRQPAQEWLMVVHEALFALLEGRLDDAEGLIADARRVGDLAVSWNADVSHGLQLYLLRSDQGRLEEVADPVRRAAEQNWTYPICRCVLAHMTASLGTAREAADVFGDLARHDFADIPFDEEWTVSLSFLAEPAALLADTRRAAVLHELLAPYADRVAVGRPEICTGSVSRYLGILASTLGRWDDAEHHFEDALAMNERIGARPWLVRTRRDFARMLQARASRGDAERAEALDAAARELAAETRMQLVPPPLARH